MKLNRSESELRIIPSHVLLLNGLKIEWPLTKKILWAYLILYFMGQFWEYEKIPREALVYICLLNMIAH